MEIRKRYFSEKSFLNNQIWYILFLSFVRILSVSSKKIVTKGVLLELSFGFGAGLLSLAS